MSKHDKIRKIGLESESKIKCQKQKTVDITGKESAVMEGLNVPKMGKR